VTAWAVCFAYGYNLQRDIQYVRRKVSFQLAFFLSLSQKGDESSDNGNMWELQSYWDCTN